MQHDVVDTVTQFKQIIAAAVKDGMFSETTLDRSSTLHYIVLQAINFQAYLFPFFSVIIQALIQVPQAMAPRSVIVSEQAPSSPLFSQAIVCNGMIYVSGNIGIDKNARKIVQGGVADRAVCDVQQRHSTSVYSHEVSFALTQFTAASPDEHEIGSRGGWKLVPEHRQGDRSSNRRGDFIKLTE